MKLHVHPRVPADIPAGSLYLTNRKLASGDVATIRSLGLRRYFLPTLTATQQDEFFRAFDAFWDDVVGGHGPESAFWRNGVASKMQEWEHSTGYLAVVLFTLRAYPPAAGADLLVLPDSVEEAEIWRAWAERCGWPIAAFGFGAIERLKQEGENLLRAMRLAMLAARRKLRAGSRVPAVRPGAFLIVTVFYRQALQAEQYSDLFFGPIHQDIARAGHDTLYVGDAIDGLQRGDRERLGAPSRPTSIYALVPWAGVLAGLWTVLVRAPRFGEVRFGGIDMGRLLSWHARRARYDFNLSAEFFHRAVRAACRRVQFSKLLHVFEGNTYERAAVQAFRNATRAAVDAYSHAVVYAVNLKLHASPAEAGAAPEADRYLVCGPLARQKLMELRRTRAAMTTACSLREIPKPSPLEGRGKRILVALDGVWSTVSLLDWLCEHADVFGAHPVVIRPHPNVSGERLWGQIPRPVPATFEISQRTLPEDLQDVSCVVYRHSSVGVQALMLGIPIIHLQVDLPLPGDPLEGVSATRTVADGPDALRAALAAAMTGRPDVSRDAGMMKEYFAAPTGDAVALFMDSAPAAAERP